MNNFLRTRKTTIVDGHDRPVTLRGVNLGGWLMMEGYILHAPNRAQRLFKKKFAVVLGQGALAAFEKAYYDHFIREEDIHRIAGLGFNCLRLPFHSRLIEKTPFRYDPAGLRYLDRCVGWAKKHGLWVILDLHAAAGAQNFDWHSDSLGTAPLWTSPWYQDRTFAIWEFVADHFRDHDTVAGYDLLNESVVEDPRGLNRFYRQLMKTIRQVDKNHILWVEGNRWAIDLDVLDEFDDDCHALSIHYYEPVEFVFNLVPQLVYPLKSKKSTFDRAAIRRRMENYRKIAERRSVPLLVGEFGVNARQGLYGEDRWLGDVVACFREAGFHWTYWTYKAVKNSIFPDGIFSYLGNPLWVNRQGPRSGWEQYAACWKKYRKEMIKSWQTENFRENKELSLVLKAAATTA